MGKARRMRIRRPLRYWTLVYFISENRLLKSIPHHMAPPLFQCGRSSKTGSCMMAFTAGMFLFLYPILIRSRYRCCWKRELMDRREATCMPLLTRKNSPSENSQSIPYPLLPWLTTPSVTAIYRKSTVCETRVGPAVCWGSKEGPSIQGKKP